MPHLVVPSRDSNYLPHFLSSLPILSTSTSHHPLFAPASLFHFFLPIYQNSSHLLSSTLIQLRLLTTTQSTHSAKMPNQKRSSMAFNNQMFNRPTTRHRKPTVPAPTISVHDAISAGQQLGYLTAPDPPPSTTVSLEDDWYDDLTATNDHFHNHDPQFPTSPSAMESTSETLARLSQGERFAEKWERALQRW